MTPMIAMTTKMAAPAVAAAMTYPGVLYDAFPEKEDSFIKRYLRELHDSLE